MTDIGALVLGADYRGLGIVRSLGRRDVPVWLAHHDDRLATYSRYARHSFEWPGDWASDQTEFLLRLADEHRLHGWVIFPTADMSAEFLSRNTAALEGAFRLTTPKWEQFSLAEDKRRVYERGGGARSRGTGDVVPRVGLRGGRARARVPGDPEAGNGRRRQSDLAGEGLGHRRSRGAARASRRRASRCPSTT